MTKKIFSPVQLSGVCILFGVILLNFAAVMPARASEPMDELRAAITAAGAPSVTEAKPEIFMTAFTAVLVSAQDRDVPAYAAAALQARPDLLGPILDEAVAALTAPGHVPSPDQMAAVARATVAVKPEAAREIVRRLIANAPEAKVAIVSAAALAAPQQTASIALAAGTSGLQVANLQGSAAPDLNRLRVADALAASPTTIGGNNSSVATADGTLNPANVATPRLRRPIVSAFY